MIFNLVMLQKLQCTQNYGKHFADKCETSLLVQGRTIRNATTLTDICHLFTPSLHSHLVVLIWLVLLQRRLPRHVHHCLCCFRDLSDSPCLTSRNYQRWLSQHFRSVPVGFWIKDSWAVRGFICMALWLFMPHCDGSVCLCMHVFSDM